MKIDIHGLNWWAEVLFSDHGNDAIHLEARIKGESIETAKAGADWIMDMFGKGRHCLIRAEPQADTYHDFDTKITSHCGYVRFSFISTPDKWQKSEYHIPTSIGKADED